MKLSAPIYVLKNQAKTLKKSELISTSTSLNRIANREGYSSWSLLISKQKDYYPNNYNEILPFFNHGDLILVGARPGQGKTSFTIGLFVQAIQQEKAKNYYFTLSEVHRDVAGRIAIYDETIGERNKLFELDYSNDICADYIIEKTSLSIGPGSLIVVDYLQLLDEKRINLPIQNQVARLKDYAKEKGCIIIFISQIKREVDYQGNTKPSIDDIRLPNPLDIKILNKVIFLHHDKNDLENVEVFFSGKFKHKLNVGWDKAKVKFY